LEESTSLVSDTLEESPSLISETVEESSSLVSEAVKESPSIVSETSEESPPLVSETVKESLSIVSEIVKESSSLASETLEESSSLVNKTLEESPSPVSETVKESSSIVSEIAEESPLLVSETLEEEEPAPLVMNDRMWAILEYLEKTVKEQQIEILQGFEQIRIERDLLRKEEKKNCVKFRDDKIIITCNAYIKRGTKINENVVFKRKVRMFGRPSREKLRLEQYGREMGNSTRYGSE